ncbi:MAG: polysaccharide pyruvyl transferase family protein [Drouetiella hepatica Uher 2000/2452]|uniref:Polysaccharide pyruvyl transferase family protein n=1 Tax=Drouetiella hepatica Uher 2000/2452 TaxID=904376 RepID=A0A951Q9L6_9CYAN|nr:polysaccharide pyruvyl transferase family protein [Drouetiella hepatica Uher 2000/2452]
MITLLRRPANPLLVRDRGTLSVPLTWVASTPNCPLANLGDALSPILVSALSGLPIVHRHFDAPQKKLACVGTIGHALKNGEVHLWGTGVDKAKHPIDRNLAYYQKPPKTKFQVHALRGAFSAQAFQQQGIEVPAVYGDPVWFLPSLIQPAIEKRYELGVIVHLSELESLNETANVREELIRYRVPESIAADVRIITTLSQPTFEALEAKVEEITACKRIISTSLHGLVIAEAYQIPCAYFQIVGAGGSFIQLKDQQARIEHRFRDFYSGLGLEQLFVYGQELEQETNWEQVIRAVDQFWSPVEWSAEAFLEAFPLPLAFNPLKGQKFEQRSLFHHIRL